MAYTGEASEAVHYALRYLRPLVTMEPCEGDRGRNGMVGGNCRLLPRLNLPDVFDLLHHANQVSPLFALEAVVGMCVCVCVCVCVCMCVVCVCCVFMCLCAVCTMRKYFLHILYLC